MNYIRHTSPDAKIFYFNVTEVFNEDFVFDGPERWQHEKSKFMITCIIMSLILTVKIWNHVDHNVLNMKCQNFEWVGSQRPQHELSEGRTIWVITSPSRTSRTDSWLDHDDPNISYLEFEISSNTAFKRVVRHSVQPSLSVECEQKYVGQWLVSKLEICPQSKTSNLVAL